MLFSEAGFNLFFNVPKASCWASHSEALLVMRRPLHGGLYAFELQRLQDAGLPLSFFLQAVQKFSLLNDDLVQLLNLVLEVSKVRFQLVYGPGVVICHPWILLPNPLEVEQCAREQLGDKGTGRRRSSRRGAKDAKVETKRRCCP